MSPIQKTNAVRWTVRFLFLAGFTALVLLVRDPPVMQAVLPACSPFLALLALAAGGASLILLPAAVVALVCIFKPRFFCCWVCPAGTCFEGVGAKLSKHRWVSKVPRLGTWFLALGAGAALMGFPLFLCFDPLAIFSSASGWLQPELTAWEKVGACVFPAMIVLAAVAPWLWCGRICPLGALQDVLAVMKDGLSRISGSARLRPQEGLRRDTAGASRSHASFSAERSVDIGRRVFLGLGVGALYRLLLNPAKLETEGSVIRPPVSGDQARFNRLCSRCGACVRACPGGIIRQGGMDCGFAGLLAPELDFSRGECPPDCTQCGQSCPTGAIPEFSIEDKFRHPLGLAVLKKDLCVLSYDRECGICMNACPHRAISISWDPVDMVSTLKVKEGLCTGCGLCQYVCPENPVAIVVEA